MHDTLGFSPRQHRLLLCHKFVFFPTNCDSYYMTRHHSGQLWRRTSLNLKSYQTVHLPTEHWTFSLRYIFWCETWIKPMAKVKDGQQCLVSVWNNIPTTKSTHVCGFKLLKPCNTFFFFFFNLRNVFYPQINFHYTWTKMILCRESSEFPDTCVLETQRWSISSWMTSTCALGFTPQVVLVCYDMA